MIAVCYCILVTMPVTKHMKPHEKTHSLAGNGQNNPGWLTQTLAEARVRGV